MSTDSEWYGEPHILTVRSVTPPVSKLDDGELEYDLEHPPSCKQEERDYGGVTVTEYACDVGWNERESGLAFSLAYSGTRVTEPGTYRVQAWGTKSYYHERGAYEYDGGVAVMGEADE